MLRASTDPVLSTGQHCCCRFRPDGANRTIVVRSPSESGELVVQPRPNQVLRGGDRKWRAGRSAAGARAVRYGDVEIFGLHRPMPVKCDFDAAARGPAGLEILDGADSGHVALDVAEGGAAGAKHQEPVKRVADAAAHGGDIVVRGLAAGGAGRV